MRIRLAPALLIVMAALPLGGCSWLVGDEGYFRDRGDDYRKSRTIPPMEVPGGQKPQSIEPLYPIPVERTDALLGETFEVPRPSPLVADGEQGVVRIQKLGETQWILLDGAPGEVWPRIRAFLLSNQIGLDRHRFGRRDARTFEQRPRGTGVAPIGEAAFALIVGADGIKAGLAAGVGEHQAGVQPFAGPVVFQPGAERIGAWLRSL